MRSIRIPMIFTAALLFFGCASPSHEAAPALREAAAPVEARLDDTVRHVIRSRIVDQTFVIDVWQPPGVPGPLPVVYVLDGNTMFGMTYQMILSMFFAGDVPPVIVVGVGYEVESAFEVVALRSRDLLPTPEADFERQMAAMGFPVPKDFETGGADAFLRFIEEELKPLVAARHPMNPKDETLVGYSYGGTFAFHTLLSSTGSFERYVIGSPVLARDGGELIADEERLAAASGRLDAHVFLSAGEYEIENGIREPVEKMIATLRSRSYPGLVLETHVFPEETHQSGIAPTVSRGLRAVFGTWPRQEPR